jgi:hypothetical protein
MDVGRESDNDDAVDGKLNPINQENGDDEVQIGILSVPAANII